jgi:hypothetical protein
MRQLLGETTMDSNGPESRSLEDIALLADRVINVAPPSILALTPQ